MKKIALLVGLGVFPLLVYPSFFLTTALPDIFAGDKNVIFLLAYESKSAFMRRLLADWWLSLPASYAAVLLIVLPLHLLLERFALRGIAPRLLAVALPSWLAASLGLRLDAWSTAAMVAGAVLVAWLFHLGVLAARRLQGVE